MSWLYLLILFRRGGESPQILEPPETVSMICNKLLRNVYSFQEGKLEKVESLLRSEGKDNYHLYRVDSGGAHWLFAYDIQKGSLASVSPGQKILVKRIIEDIKKKIGEIIENTGFERVSDNVYQSNVYPGEIITFFEQIFLNYRARWLEVGFDRRRVGDMFPHLVERVSKIK